ncbi:hypothetical protein KDA_49300 [Dictyobacter alpinus]|uniref:Methyltransferase domain-containing protein n=1 Tax=Dictyobacter alpinus TaxID=2014873 RepID=A0A402BDR4_9CHLR|nr:methyltransferase domain-containing protein [Dictyobacter alpinus]GCE29446.1 hypothetical protein KDA_49300 [Dictyobacter alpinus]
MERNDYFIDPESAAEMARLLEQDKLITGGKPLPEQSAEMLEHIIDVLDIACGPGGWALELSRLAPHMHITGIDISERMIAFANQLARAESANAHFVKMDIKDLSFEEETFDLINMRFIGGFMLRESWMPLIEKCKSLLRPGGILRLTESEAAITNNAAQTEMTNYIVRSMYLSNRGFNPTTTMGIVNQLPSFLRQAGFQQVHIHPSAIDISYGQEQAQAVQQDFSIALQLLKPFLLRANIISSPQVFDDVLAQMRDGWSRPDYTGIWFLLTAWGIK